MSRRTAKLLWGVVVFVTALYALTPAFADCEPHLSVGKTLPNGSDRPTGVVSIGCRGAKYDFTATWANESLVYQGQAMAPAFGFVSVSRHWLFQGRAWLGGGRPTALAGLSLKGSQRCAKQGELDCNRRVPLPVSFHWGLGVQWSQWRVEMFHDSNDALDYGPEKKNLGLNWVHLTYRWN